MRLIALLLIALPVQAADWPGFRGPDGTAVSGESRLPAEWGKDKNVAWKVALPGYGWSCPIVWGDKVFVTTAVSDKQKKPTAGPGGFGGPGGGFGGGGPKGGPGSKGGFGRQEPPDDVYKFQVICMSAADGKILWRQTAREGRPTIPTQASNTYASETPVTDGERVYAYFGMHGLYAYDFAGTQVWKLDLGSYPMALGFGTGSSPALADGKVIVQCDNEKDSFLVAVDAKTGKEAWRTKRTERSAYSSPFVWKNKARTEIICLGSQKVRSYDPASGKQLWELGGMTGQPKATPAATDELLFVGTGGGPSGFGGGFGRPSGPKGGPDAGPKGGPPKGGFGMGSGNRPLFAVRPGAGGDITLKEGVKSSDAIAWTDAKAGPQTSSPLVYQGYLYILEERGGTLACYDATTGKQQYKERLGGRGFTSSPWAYDGKVFCLDDSGTTHVVQAGPTFKELGKNVTDGLCWSTPAVSQGSVFLRTVDTLYCLRLPK